MFKAGDRVLFSTEINGLKTNIGMIISKSILVDITYKIICFPYNIVYKNIKEEQIIDISSINKIRIEIEEYYNSQISELESKLKKVTTEEKLQERVNKYNSIKELIVKNCQRVVVCTDDDEFENRLKEINKLKKELHTIELDGADIIRKENGTIKYKIKETRQKFDNELKRISDNDIKYIFD